MKTGGGREWLPIGILLAITAMIFARVAGFPFVNWDDPSHFADNPLSAHPLARGWRELFLTREIGYPAPVLLLSFALDRALFGMHPAAWHAENVVLHLVNVGLLFILARRMRLSQCEALAVAALAAFHPLVVEPVAWVTGRKDVLAEAMVLGAALVASGGARAWRWLVANALAGLAVLVVPRTVVASILVVILVCHIRNEWRIKRAALRMAPGAMFAIGVAVVGARQIAELGALPPPRSPSGVVLDIAGAWALQLSHLVFPVDLLAYYFREPGDPSIAAMILAAVVTVVVVVLIALRAPAGSPSRTGLLLALLAYAPVSCVVVILRWTANSYMYFPLAMIGLSVVPAIVRAWPAGLARFGRGAAAAYFAILAVLAFVETSRWSSSSSVWSGSIARYPNEPLSYEHEALAALADGRIDEANKLFIDLADRFPDWDDTLDDEVRAFQARGDERRASAILERGVRAGSPACIQMYWLGLIASEKMPPAEARDLISIAFDQGFAAMQSRLRDPDALTHVVAILRAMGLDERAGRVLPLIDMARHR